jgi:hypothetical protein
MNREYRECNSEIFERCRISISTAIIIFVFVFLRFISWSIGGDGGLDYEDEGDFFCCCCIFIY